MLIYEGPNHSGTGNIAVIATGIEDKCSNRKTGDMVQIWILPADELPTEALKSGGDSAVCGTCPLRPANGGGCYVNVGQAPNSIWRKYKRGGYPLWGRPGSPYQSFNKPVRIGAYGDVAEIPTGKVLQIIRWAYHGHTCYTHMWRTRPDLQDIAMASVETIPEYQEANDLGWSTFRVTDGKSWTNHNEMLCPSEVTECTKCKLCCGTERGQRAIYIPAHGATAKRVHQERS